MLHGWMNHTEHLLMLLPLHRLLPSAQQALL
jgi:hypothetical protein